MTLHEEEEEEESKMLANRSDYDELDQDTGMWGTKNHATFHRLSETLNDVLLESGNWVRKQSVKNPTQKCEMNHQTFQDLKPVLFGWSREKQCQVELCFYCRCFRSQPKTWKIEILFLSSFWALPNHRGLSSVVEGRLQKATESYNEIVVYSTSRSQFLNVFERV